MAAYSEVIKSTHWFIPKDELRQPLPSLKRLLTVRSKFEDREDAPAWAETQTHFGVPLYYRDIGRQADRIDDRTSVGETIDIEFTSTLRERQEPVLMEFDKALTRDKHGIMLKAPTGTGKTVMTADMLARLNRTALVIVPREIILKQWKDRLLAHTTLREDEIGIIQGDKCDWRGKKVVVAMVHTLVSDNRTWSEELLRYFGVVVYDEIHTAGAETFSRACSMFYARWRIGMSATIDKRADGMDDLYKMHISEKYIEMKGSTEVTPTILLRAYKTESRNKYLKKLKDAKRRRGVIISELAKDTARNALLCLYLKKFVESGRRTLLMSDRVEQLEIIKRMLTTRHKMIPKDVGIICGKTKEAERHRILANCQVILATYGVFAMAVDVPDLRALIFATPLSDVEQSIGRVTRLCESAKDPFILDIIDETFHDTIRWAYNRQRLYKSAGVKLVSVQTNGS